MKKTETLIICLFASLFMFNCGQPQLKSEPVCTQGTDCLNDGGFEYVFEKPKQFKVGEADRGATLSWEANPQVAKYLLHSGMDENLDGITGVANPPANPLDIDNANIIRITDGSLNLSTQYCFAVEALDASGTSAGITAPKCLTVRDMIGVEVSYKVKMSACIAGDNLSRFTFKEGRMFLTMNDNESGRFPGQGGNKCMFDGVNLELQKLDAGNATGPKYYFPPLSQNAGKAIMSHIGSSINLTQAVSNPDLANMITEEPMTVEFDGSFKKVCQGGLLNKVRVTSRDESGPVADNTPINSLDFDITKCSKGNWFTFHDTKGTAIEFILHFQTGQ